MPSPTKATSCSQSVHYESDFVSIPQPGESEVSKTGRLLMGIAAHRDRGPAPPFCSGFSLGGGRALYRLSRGKPISSVYDTEFIRLNLRK